MKMQPSAALHLAQRAKWHVGVLDDEVRDKNIVLSPEQIAAVKEEIVRIRADLDLVANALADQLALAVA